jgi:hypothetical protein
MTTATTRRRRPPRRDGLPVLDWRSNHDPASRRFAAVELAPTPPVHDVLWRPGPRLPINQGSEGSCSGHGPVSAIGTQPLAYPNVSHSMAVQWYHLNRRRDEWPGENYDGSSVTAAMKVGREYGWWGEYRWAFGVEDMRHAIQLGPLVLGIPWASDMYATRADGIVRTAARFDEQLGHCLAVIGWQTDYQGAGPGFWWLNSWGRGYGVNGVAYVPEPIMRKLVDKAHGGECAVPVGLKVGRSLDV